MKRIVLAPALALILGSGLAFAQPSGTQDQTATKRPAKAAVIRFSGTVESVDAAASKLNVKNKKGETKEFALGAETKITKGGKKAALADVAVGDSVSVASQADQVKTVVVRIVKKK